MIGVINGQVGIADRSVRKKALAEAQDRLDEPQAPFLNLHCDNGFTEQVNPMGMD